jgi:hypothetical protein
MAQRVVHGAIAGAKPDAINAAAPAIRFVIRISSIRASVPRGTRVNTIELSLDESASKSKV